MANGDAWGKGARDFFRANWFLIIALVGVLGWGIRIEARTENMATVTHVQAARYETLLILEEYVGEIKEDIAYIRGKVEFLDPESAP